MPSRVNFRSINKYIASNSAIQRACENIIVKKIEVAKQSLINDFESHPVSTEISAGASASNSSGTLGGYGNLFTFIGFNSGDKPVTSWVNFIRQKVQLQRGSAKISASESAFNISFSINKISSQDLVAYAKMPWEPGRSWITGIEKGISGFSNYIVKKLAGRSGGGLQSKSAARSGQFSRSSYWAAIWNKFEKELIK